MEEKTKTLEERKVEALETIAFALNEFVSQCVSGNGYLLVGTIQTNFV